MSGAVTTMSGAVTTMSGSVTGDDSTHPISLPVCVSNRSSTKDRKTHIG